ncbi:hypothetical protein J4573_28660 [Actinomadura barringtoniae]|uniref:Uncharacterized protein n=1 Tax=Actinomadura barringtoniae TaxID=1427535 RepID=A0A939T980_9ACTN|nr:hypothetical protein [Actinomadura barringtoniae]MBO2451102.1 hypothetical protein [Actinomadura barringtoniae]
MGDVDADGNPTSDIEDRIGARVMIGAPGLGRDLAEGAAEHYPAVGHSTFDAMTPPVLVVIGTNDHHPFFSARDTWRSDAYTQSPSPKTALYVAEGEHTLGGISGFDSTETSDENPERVAVVRAMIWAYLRSELYPGDTAWADSVAALAAAECPLGTVETR